MTHTQQSVAGEESLCRMCYLTELNLQKVTEDIDARICELRIRVAAIIV